MSDCGLMTKSGERLSLRRVDTHARVTGLLAETKLVQKYQNDTGSNVELTYIFPLPLGATLLALSVSIGSRCYHGEVIPRAEAEQVYEKSIAEGNSAFRLQEIRSGMYSVALCVFHPNSATHNDRNPPPVTTPSRPPIPPAKPPLIPIKNPPGRRVLNSVTKTGVHVPSDVLLPRNRRIDSPLSSIRCAPLTNRSRIASAIVGFPPLK